jgi:hypothetical protein
MTALTPTPTRPACIACGARPAGEFYPRCSPCEGAAQRRVLNTRTCQDLLRLIAQAKAVSELAYDLIDRLGRSAVAGFLGDESTRHIVREIRAIEYACWNAHCLIGSDLPWGPEDIRRAADVPKAIADRMAG